MKIAGINFSRKAYEEINDELENLIEDYEEESIDPINQFESAIETYCFNHEYSNEKTLRVLNNIDQIFQWFTSMKKQEK